MVNDLEKLKREFPLIPEYQIKNLTKCTTDELVFELGYCYWRINKKEDTDYIHQLKEFIINNLFKKNNYV
jgi:hypothetical protein